MEYFADLHIHSCLSPCANDDMTPCNICGMAVVKELDIIAVADHNTARNLPAIAEVAAAYGLTLLPAIEITSKEEVHVLGYFPTVEIAVAFGEMLKTHLPPMKNKPRFFGEQLVMNSDDEVIANEDALLIGATDLPISDIVRLVGETGGLAVPAHINRGSNGLLINLGMMPPDIDCPTLEVWRFLPCDEEVLRGKHVLHASDAHELGAIQEREHALRLPECSVDALLAWMKSEQKLDA